MIPFTLVEGATQLLVLASLTACGIAAALPWLAGKVSALQAFVRIDATAELFLALINPIFLGISIYVWSRVTSTPQLRQGIRRFVALALLFLAASNAAIVARDLVVQCVALELTTLAAAPLIVRPRHAASREASWHYLLFSMVGLGLVFLGLLFLDRGVAAPAWHRLGLFLVLLGLGAKLGLVPMFAWLPPAYDHAPPAVTAALGAVQFNAALVMLLRVVQTWRATDPALIGATLVTMGLLSMAVSTLRIIATTNLKRLLAYASINHAGVIAVGLGLGHSAGYGLLLYALSNAYIKAILFLTAGRIKAHYGTKDTRAIRGLLKQLPYSGVFLMIGTFALLGFPPFGSFLGEILILSTLVGTGHELIFAVFCVLVIMTFVATARTIFPMIWADTDGERSWPPETFPLVMTKIAILIALVILGVWIPPAVDGAIHGVAATLEAP